MIYLPNKGKRGMLIGFLPNMESVKGARANQMHSFFKRAS